MTKISRGKCTAMNTVGGGKIQNITRSQKIKLRFQQILEPEMVCELTLTHLPTIMGMPIMDIHRILKRNQISGLLLPQLGL
jgi:hypothetical protein